MKRDKGQFTQTKVGSKSVGSVTKYLV